MTAIFFDAGSDDNARRNRLYAGDLCVLPPNSSSLELCELARRVIAEAFAGHDPEYAQFHMPADAYARILADLKPRFIHHPDAKRIIARFLVDVGCDPDRTHFDVPRLRTATSTDYLSTGIAYAFHPHRDTWYSAPMCQINWWLPVYPIGPDNAMAFHPRYWATPLRNTSDAYDYQRWNDTSRFNAVNHLKEDTRIQPKATEPVALEPDIRIIPPVGGVLAFSGAQLHSTVPNTSGRTRFSIDFRTVDSADAHELRGAKNADSRCTGTSMPDYLRVSDLQHLPDALIERYMPGHPQIAPA